jgi:hypothetical protein
MQIANESDVIFLQEHWLLDSQLHKVVSFLPGFTGTAISGVNSSQSVWQGRPYGGCALLWRDNLSHCIVPCNIKCLSQRVCGCIMKTGSDNILLLSVYFPTDSQNGSCLADVDILLGDIDHFIDTTQCTKIILGGDINCDFARNTPLVSRVRSFIDSHNIRSVWDNFPIDFTHCHTDYMSTSIIDHFLTSISREITHASTMHHVDNTSRHSAITMHMSISLLSSDTINCDNVHDEHKLSKCAWYKASSLDIMKYQDKLNSNLQKIIQPPVLMDCHNMCCNNYDHHVLIDNYCSAIIDAIMDASNCIPQTSPSVDKHRIPGWNVHIKPYRSEALYWHTLWKQHGKPNSGLITDMMRASRRDYHYAIRQVRRHENQLKKEAFLQSLLQGDRKFHIEVKKFKGVKPKFSNCVNGKRGTRDISEVFAQEYNDLFNSCEYEADFIRDFTECLNSHIRDTEIKGHVQFSSFDIQKAIKNIKFRKTDGVFNLVSDNFKHATMCLYDHITSLLNTCMSHGYIPHCLLLSSLIPIPKDKLGDKTNSQNYRGIAICALCLKIFEYVILLNNGTGLSSSDHQFAYKRKSSTTMCTWTAREVVSYYKNNGSEIFACMLDCSKAFDKIRYDILFKKLLQRGVPPVIIRFIFYSYTNSQVKVRWNSAESNPFTVCNGVRQGAVLSPFLFNIYVDELIHNLSEDGAGCWIGNAYYGVLVYADDILLLAPSLTSLQCMIKTCEHFGSTVGLNFNSKKTVCINFHRNGHCPAHNFSPEVYLNGKALKWCNEVKHLGHILTCCMSSNADIIAKKSSFISCVNNIQAEFAFAHPSTKMKLLNIYGTSFYGSNLWNLYDSSSDRLFKTWNIALRKLFDLPYNTHTRFLDEICRARHISITLKLRFLSFIQSLLKSTNSIVQNLICSCIFNHTSPSGLMLSNILHEFDVGDLSDFPFITTDLRTCIIEKYNILSTLSDDERSYCDGIKELIDCRHGIKECGLLNNECSEMIQFLSTI